MRKHQASDKSVDRHGHTRPARVELLPRIVGVSLIILVTWWPSAPHAADSPTGGGDALTVEINKIGLGKEVVITKGSREWFMRVEVTPEDTVVVRQEKDGETYVVDESEVHDGSMSPEEIDATIKSFVDNVTTRAAKP